MCSSTWMARLTALLWYAMFSTMASTAQQEQRDTATPERSYAKLVEEEIPIQRTNLPINGGLPSCITTMDNFLLCFGASLLHPAVATFL